MFCRRCSQPNLWRRFERATEQALGLFWRRRRRRIKNHERSKNENFAQTKPPRSNLIGRRRSMLASDWSSLTASWLGDYVDTWATCVLDILCSSRHVCVVFKREWENWWLCVWVWKRENVRKKEREKDFQMWPNKMKDLFPVTACVVPV